MRRLLYIGDHGPSGFGTVAKGLLTYLHNTNKYDILQLGINYNDAIPADVPWEIVPAGFWYPVGGNLDGVYNAADPYGTKKAQTYTQSFDPDIVFINNDFTVVGDYLTDRDGKPSALAKHRSKKIIYSPLDSFPFPPRFAKVAKQFDKVIAYSAWQKSLMVQADPTFADVPIMYHGVETETFYPMDKDKAKKQLVKIFRDYSNSKKAKIPRFDEKYIVFFVGTNQWRKDLPCLFKAFYDFNQIAADAFLLPLSSMAPMTPSLGGWALYNLRDLTGVKNSVILQHANVFTPEQINVMYNAADVLAYPTRGEGFGLPSFEAMATKTPVIATRFGPQFEIHSDDRGYFIDVMDYEPGINGAWTYFAKPSHMSLVERLLHVYNNRDEAQQTADNAYEWVKSHTWNSKGKQLDGIFEECLSPLNNRSTSPSIPKHHKKT